MQEARAKAAAVEQEQLLYVSGKDRYQNTENRFFGLTQIRIGEHFASAETGNRAGKAPGTQDN